MLFLDYRQRFGPYHTTTLPQQCLSATCIGKDTASTRLSSRPSTAVRTSAQVFRTMTLPFPCRGEASTDFACVKYAEWIVVNILFKSSVLVDVMIHISSFRFDVTLFKLVKEHPVA